MQESCEIYPFIGNLNTSLPVCGIVFIVMITYETYAHILDSTKREAVEKMTTAIYNPESDENDKPDQMEEVEQNYTPVYHVVSGGFN